MIRRRRFLQCFASGVLWASLDASAQPKALWRIGYFGGGTAPADGAPPAGLRQALADLGYVEGRNIVFIGRWADMKSDRLVAIANEFAELRPDVLIVIGYPAAEAARRASTSVPIVVSNAGDPDAMGLVASLSHPGGNVTGISDQSATLSAKRMEILKQVQPGATRVAVLWNASNQAMTSRYHEIERAAEALKVTIQPLAVRDAADFDRAFATMKSERPDALLVVTDALTNANQNRLLEWVGRSDMPAMYEIGSVVRQGGLMSYGPRQGDTFRRLAGYVDRILKGARPADLPVEQPTEFEFVINLKAAKALGIAIPQSVFLRADEVIQ